jgi:hypothetical protein
MDEAQAISLVVDWIRTRRLDYPTTGLEADPFEGGWAVYAPVDIDESDPMAFLELPVGRSVFLVGYAGRIEEVPSSVPPQQAIDRFMAWERGSGHTGRDEVADEYMAEFWEDEPRDPLEISVVGPPPGGSHEDPTAAEASRLIEPIVRQLAVLGPPDWEWLWAEFAFTVSAEIAHLRFWSYNGTAIVPVPEPIAALVRDQRRAAARMPAGPWWRLLLTVTNLGETTVKYDYGDGPFPYDQLLPAEDYRNDLEAYPRPHVPEWLVRYIDSSAAQQHWF